MTSLKATTDFLDDIQEVMKAEGWKDGDSVDVGGGDSYNVTDKYFFLDMINNAYLSSDYVSIRELYALYSVGTSSPNAYADDEISKHSTSGVLAIYMPDPFTKKKLLQFEGIEERMDQKGWQMSVTSTSSYDQNTGLRQLYLTFTKDEYDY